MTESSPKGEKKVKETSRPVAAVNHWMKCEKQYYRSQEDARKGDSALPSACRMEKLDLGGEKNEQILPTLTMIHAICFRSGFRQLDLQYHTTLPDHYCGIRIVKRMSGP